MTDVILDPARHANDDDEGIRTHTSQNETAQGYAETQREVVATDVQIFRQACDLAEKKKMLVHIHISNTNFYKQLNLICKFTLS